MSPHFPTYKFICWVRVHGLLNWLNDLPFGAWGRTQGPLHRVGMMSEDLPWDLIDTVMEPVLKFFPGAEMGQKLLSKAVPGLRHETHTDAQPQDWVTRIHIPITSNPEAKMTFGGIVGVLPAHTSELVHFEVGKAYSLDTRKPHAFFNLGETDRVHLLVDLHSDGWQNRPPL